MEVALKKRYAEIARLRRHINAEPIVLGSPGGLWIQANRRFLNRLLTALELSTATAARVEAAKIFFDAQCEPLTKAAPLVDKTRKKKS